MRALPNIKTKDLSTELKKQALLFDQIGIYNADWNFEQIRNGPLYPIVSSWLNELELEIEWLKDKGIIIDLEKAIHPLAEIDFNKRQDVRTKHSEESWELISQFLKSQKVSSDKLIMNLAKSDALRLREYVLDFVNSEEYSVVSSLEVKDYLYDIPESRKTVINELVINKLPVPSLLTPWEKIVDYRADPESNKRLIALRRWISNTSSGNHPVSEIEEEFEGLIDDFQTHMNHHKIKTNTAILKVFLKMPLDFITLQWSNLVDPFFVFKEREISLTEAELNAPGKEIAYIIKAGEDFSDEE